MDTIPSENNSLSSLEPPRTDSPADRLASGEQEQETDNCVASSPSSQILSKQEDTNIIFTQEFDNDDIGGVSRSNSITCPQCSDVFISERMLNRHIYAYHKRLLPCLICEKSFADRAELKRHVQVHTENKPFCCHLCQKHFKTRSHLDHHMDSVHKKIRHFMCNICGKSFFLKGELNRHTRTHTKEKPFSCPVCQKAFAEKGNCDRHIKIHNPASQQDNKNFPCTFEYIDNCEPKAKSPTQEELSSDGEIKTSHVNIDLNIKIKTEPTFQQAENCESKASSSVQSQNVQIDNCDVKTEYPSYADVGEIKMEPPAQPNDALSQGSQEELLCTLCNKLFTNKGGLTRHIKHQHQKLERFCCPLCDQTFTYKTSRTKHINVVHNKSKPFSCELCSKSFISKTDLTRHVRSHTGEKPFTCTLCNDSFTLKRNLNIHIDKVHHNLKPFSCTLCSKSYSSKQCLSRHVDAVHEQKAFLCTLCGKLFSYKSDCARHIEVVHNKSKHFACSWCDKQFADKTNLAKHLKTHKGHKLSSTKITEGDDQKGEINFDSPAQHGMEADFPSQASDKSDLQGESPSIEEHANQPKPLFQVFQINLE